MTELIVADASPLIVLARVRQLKTLAEVAGKVIVPDEVAQECLYDTRLPAARQIGQAFGEGLLHRQPGSVRIAPLELAGLDPGETAAIGLAIALAAPILIDERIGRQAALAHSLKVIGTLGILLRAKERGLIEAVAPVIASLKREGFFIAAALETAALKRAEEH